MSFGGHPSKTDRATLTHAKDVGYDLATVLMVRGDDGAPIAPGLVSLTTADGVLSTRDDAPAVDISHIDQVLRAMQYVHDLVRHDRGPRDRPRGRFGQPLAAMGGRRALGVGPRRRPQGPLRRARDVVGRDRRRLHQEDAFKDAGAALYHGRKAQLYVAEAEVVLHRPGKRNEGKKKIEIPGPPLPLRLVVTEVRDFEGRVLARWLLLTNVPAALADAATIARWYYFRWRIESLTSCSRVPAGSWRDWLQRNGERILIKLMLALGACASIWALERRHDAESEASSSC